MSDCARLLLPALLVATPCLAFEFALIGDMPYSPEDSLRFERLMARIDAEELAFVLHVGDFKAGASPCADGVLEGRRAWFERFAAPFVLVPGDNEWTDCHRQSAGGWAPLERQARLRSLFFTPPGRVLGRRAMAVTSQAADPAYREFPEHLRWSRDGVVFATLHIVGSANGTAGFAGRTGADDREVERRTAAAIEWMRASFRAAGDGQASGILLAIHGNPQFDADEGSERRSPYAAFLAALAQETIARGKPVVLAHGDSHYFRIDKPLTGPTGNRLDRFTRVEAFGSPHIHWVRVRVDRSDPMVFDFRQELVPGNALAE